MNTRRGFRPFLALALIIGSTTAGADDEFPESVVLAPDGGDTYAAGETVDIRDRVAGDLVAAGSTIRVSGEVTDDLIAAGGTIEVYAPVGDDVRLAGADVELAAPVQGHAVIAGADVHVTADASVKDWLWVAGSRVELNGDIGGELRASAAVIELNGRIGGNAELAGAELIVGDDAVIEGDLIWRSRDPITISESADVRGEIIQAPMPDMFDEDEYAEASFSARIFLAISLFLTAGVLLQLFPHAVAGWGATVAARPVASLITGLAFFATGLLVVILLFASAVGWLLGVLALLVYLLMLLLAGFAGMNALASIGLFWARRGNSNPPSRAMRWGALAVVALVVVFVGPLYTLLALMGLGATSLHFYAEWSV